jgi:hypothetical protein
LPKHLVNSNICPDGASHRLPYASSYCKPDIVANRCPDLIAHQYANDNTDIQSD